MVTLTPLQPHDWTPVLDIRIGEDVPDTSRTALLAALGIPGANDAACWTAAESVLRGYAKDASVIAHLAHFEDLETIVALSDAFVAASDLLPGHRFTDASVSLLTDLICAGMAVRLGGAEDKIPYALLAASYVVAMERLLGEHRVPRQHMAADRAVMFFVYTVLASTVRGRTPDWIDAAQALWERR